MANEYLAELELLKINVKAKNFLVFQGSVELIAIKSPKELTTIFEDISGSGALKEEYEKLEMRQGKEQEQLKDALQKKKALNVERKFVCLEIDEADKYSRLKDELNGKIIEHQLFLLFHNERSTIFLENDVKIKYEMLANVERTKEKLEDKMKEMKKDHCTMDRELGKIEQDIREAELEMCKKESMFIKAKEYAALVQKKMDDAKKTLNQANRTHEAHINGIRKLEDELDQVNREKAEYEARIADESQSQGRDIHLEAAQLGEYHRLKEQVAKRSARDMQDWDSLHREQTASQDRLDNISRLRAEAESKHMQKCHGKKELQERIAKLTEHIRLVKPYLRDRFKGRKDGALREGFPIIFIHSLF